MIHASERRREAIVELLLSAGANVDLKDNVCVNWWEWNLAALFFIFSISFILSCFFFYRMERQL